MPPAFVQTVADATPATGSTRTLTLGAGIQTTAGHLLSLWARGTAGLVISSVSDSAGNAWQIDQNSTSSTNTVNLASCILATGKALGPSSTITVHVSNGGNNTVGCAEFSGVVASGGMPAVDQAVSSFNAIAGNVTAATVSQGQAADLVICAIGSSANSPTFSLTTADPDSGGTWTQMDYPGTGADAAYQIGTTASLYSCTWLPSSGNGDAALVSYKSTLPPAPTPEGGLFPLLVAL